MDYLTGTILLLAAAASVVTVVSGFRLIVKERDRGAYEERTPVIRIRKVSLRQEEKEDLQQPEVIPFTEDELDIEAGADTGMHDQTPRSYEEPAEEIFPPMEETPEEPVEKPLRKSRVNRKNSKSMTAGHSEEGPDRPLELFDEFTY